MLSTVQYRLEKINEAIWKEMERHPNIALSSSSLLDTTVYFPPWGCGLKNTPLNKPIFKICLPGCRVAKGEIWLTNSTTECSCQCLPIWLFWHSHLNGIGSMRQTLRQRAADGTPVRKWVAKVLLPDTLWLINMRPQPSWACVLDGHRVDSDKTMCWKHLHNFLDFCFLQSSGCNTVSVSFITVLFLLKNIIQLNTRAVD